MEAITNMATVNVARSQRVRWQSGHLAQEWRTRFPNLFDDDDLRIAKSQASRGTHFYEWLGAIVLHRMTGYLSLVEKYEFATHPRKQQIAAQLLPRPVRDALRDRKQARAQAPDLLMYAEDLSDWFFCEVKGARDRLRAEQIRKFELLADMTSKPVRLLEVRLDCASR